MASETVATRDRARPTTPMTSASELIEHNRRVFERSEFRWEDDVSRLRIEITGNGAVESWTAGGEGGKFVFRPSEPEDPAPHVTLRTSAEDFARHMRGETDLLGGPETPIDLEFASDAPGLSQEHLVGLTTRLMSALAVECQCRDAFRGTPMEELYLSWRSPREDGTDTSMGSWSLPHYAGVLLYDMVMSERPQRTLEVGLAHGLSALFIARAHKDKGGGAHVAIDPCQSSWFGNCGVKNLERAGLGGYVQVMEEPNYVALPGLIGARFQLIFIDGLHIFDHVVLDFFYSDLLLDVGGYMVFDDSKVPAVEDALRFISENRFDSYEKDEARSTDRITVFRKTAEDSRIEKHGVMFHRQFSASAPTPEPLPPPSSPRALKHALDRVLALAAAIVAAPVGLLIAMALVIENLLTGRGAHAPLQRTRSVSAGRPFEMIAFRTDPRDGRRSAVSALVERLHLTKLPMLWNVLCGRMSIVGRGRSPPGTGHGASCFGRAASGPA